MAVLHPQEYYTFNLAEQSTIPIITAIGTSQVFAIHQAHAGATISLTNKAGIATCVCDAGSQGAICSANFTGCHSFTKNCVPPPAGSLLAQKNPTCNSRQYAGLKYRPPNRVACARVWVSLL